MPGFRSRTSNCRVKSAAGATVFHGVSAAAADVAPSGHQTRRTSPSLPGAASRMSATVTPAGYTGRATLRARLAAVLLLPSYSILTIGPSDGLC